MKKTGELLKKSREEKGLSVHEVALSLKINPRILQAIEEGEQATLPAKTFLRGFIQSYAKFLKLDPQEVLRVFTEEMNVVVPAPSPVSTGPNNEKSEGEIGQVINIEDVAEEKPVKDPTVDAFKNSVLTKTENQNDALRARTIAISIIGLLLVIIVYFVNSVVKKYQREAELAPEVTATLETAEGDTSSDSPAASTPETSTTPSESTNAPTTVATPTETVKPMPPAAHSTSATATTTVTPAPHTPATTPAKIPTPVAPPAPAVTAKPAAPAPTAATKPATPQTPAVTAAPVVKPAAPVPAVKPTTPAATTAVTTPPAAPTPATPKPAEGKLTEVIIEATDDVEIEYSSSKSPPQKLVLKPDQIHTFKSRSGVKLKISNGGGVNVIVNGQDRGAPGASGQPIQVSYE